MSFTTDDDLLELAHQFDIPLQIYWKEQLPKTLKNGNYIINMGDPVDGIGEDLSGTHWVFSVVRGKTRLYFDSFGVLPPNDVEKALKNDYHYSTKQIQNISGGHCGLYCMGLAIWLKDIPEKDLLKAYQEYLNVFSNDTKKNLKILKKLLHSWGIALSKI